MGKEDYNLVGAVGFIKEKVPKIRRIDLFGSRAKNNHNADSDYDILVTQKHRYQIPDEVFEEVFSLPSKFDIKMDWFFHSRAMIGFVDREIFKQWKEFGRFYGLLPLPFIITPLWVHSHCPGEGNDE